MNLFKIIKEKLQFFNKFGRKMRIIFLVLLLLICFSVFFYFSNNGKTNLVAETKSGLNLSEDYSSYVEQKLQSLLLKMSSISKVSVFVMTSGSALDNYLFENEEISNNSQTNQSTTKKNEVVFQKSGSSNYPVKTSTTYPEITGVLIYLNKVDILTKNNIQKAVSTVLNIDPSCIYILQEG